MSDTVLALIAYISWIIILLFLLAGYRTYMASSGVAKSLKFKADGTDLDALGERITRTQANCVESFSFIGGTMLLALATDSSAITDSLAFVLLAARLAQSLIHVISTSNAAIQFRFVMFLIQVGICIYWLYMLALTFM